MSDSSDINAVAIDPGDILANAFARYQRESKGPTDYVLNAFYRDTRVRRIVESNVRTFKIPDLKEEVWQRLAELFWDKLLGLLVSQENEPDNVYKAVFAGAKFVSMSIKKEKARDDERLISTDVADDEDMISVVDEQVRAKSEDFTDIVNAKIDQEYAGMELMKRLSLQPDHHIFPMVEFVDARPAVVTKKRVKPAATDTSAADELAAIRTKLGIKNMEFAERLGIGLPTLSSYLYRRVQKVPDKVMDVARALVNDGPTDHDHAVSLFANKQMSEIVARWERIMDMVGAEDADKRIASILKVDQITVWRWRNNETRPSIAEIGTFDREIKLKS
jgi:hypothetical protein